MAVLRRLSERELFLLTVPSDEEDSPWMVMADLQVRDVDMLKAILLLHAQRQRLPWYVASYLKITMPRPVGERPLEVAPDLLVAEAADRLRTSWNVVEEGRTPEFVLEVSSEWSWGRDTQDKPEIYDAVGVSEYVVFAPERRDGPKLFGWRRDAAGSFVEWGADERGVLWSEALGGLGLYIEAELWLRALDAQGRRLPTPFELAAEAAAGQAEAEHRAAEAAAAYEEADRRADAESAARLAAERRAAEAEAARLDAERRLAEEVAARLEAERRAAAAEAEVARLREELRRSREQ